MALANPAADLATYLHGRTAGPVTLSRGVNLFVGVMRAEEQAPSPAAFLLNTGGPPSVPYLGGERIAYFRATVQILVRGAARQLEAGESFARAVLSLLHLAPVPNSAGGEYTAVVARDSAPAFLSEDDSRRPVWALNFECQYKGQAG